MEKIVQVPESKNSPPQKPTKPTSIKILQWVYLSVGFLYLAFILLATGSGKDPFTGDVIAGEELVKMYSIPLAVIAIGVGLMVSSRLSLVASSVVVLTLFVLSAYYMIWVPITTVSSEDLNFLMILFVSLPVSALLIFTFVKILNSLKKFF
jgi:hypothetical protein